jgi:hypothetical protein
MNLSKTCPNHEDRYIYCKNLCKSCYNTYLKNTNPEYASKQRRNTAEWIRNNSERKKESDKKWVAKQDKAYLKSYKRMKQIESYGLSLQQYEDMKANQNGVCAICNKIPANNKSLQIDHNHRTGKVRGLLCFRCNFGMSYFSEDVERFKRVVVYLEENDGKNQ